MIVKTITVPANTPADNPMTEYVELPKGILHRIEYLFPWGHFCLLRVAVFYGLEQISPYHESEWLCGNGETVRDDLYFELPEKPTTLTVKLYNLDEVYDHTIYIRFHIKQEKQLTESLLTRLLRGLGLMR